MVADRHRHADVIISTGNELLRNVNIDDLERPWTPKIGVRVNFSQFWAVTRISRVNCAEMAGYRLRQPAHEIFSIECRFQQSTYGPCRFKEVCARGCQSGVPL